MKTRTTHKGLPKALSTSQKKVIGKGSKSKINLSDMPETVFSRKARRGLFYRPRKMSVTIRLDEDLLTYYRAHAPEGRYQTEINRVLREQMERK